MKDETEKGILRRLQRYNKFPSHFLPKLIILVEGVTEQVLLPYFANTYGLDLLSKGAMIVAAGGANRLVRKYLYLSKRISLPIFCLFDRDAQTYAQRLASSLREKDSLYVLTDGEIEDLWQLDFLIDQLNHYLMIDPLHDSSTPIVISDFISDTRRTVILDKMWRQRELGKFEKVKFAQFIIGETCTPEVISANGKHMLDKLSQSINLALNL